MRYQVCEIRNGELRHFYVSETGKPRLSKNRATMLKKEHAMRVIQMFSHRDLFIQSEYDCHFREIESDGTIINPKRETVDMMMDYYPVDAMEMKMQENGVSWSDFI